MHTKQCLIISALVAFASAHGLLRSITGANGVLMPGLSVVDGTPRGAGAATAAEEKDVSIIKDNDQDPLGTTPGFGPVKAETNFAKFFGSAAGGAVNAADVVGNTSTTATPAKAVGKKHKAGARHKRAAAGGDDPETIVGDTAGKGATSGLPTVGDDGTISLTYHQVNGDGAGPVSAEVDSTSGGTDVKAFQTAQVTKQLPGTNGNSGAAQEDFDITVKIPAGTTCQGTVAGVKNVCIVRVRNPSGAGPFGGSAAFTQSKAAKKRAIEFREKMMKKRSMAFVA